GPPAASSPLPGSIHKSPAPAPLASLGAGPGGSRNRFHLTSGPVAGDGARGSAWGSPAAGKSDDRSRPRPGVGPPAGRRLSRPPRLAAWGSKEYPPWAPFLPGVRGFHNPR